MELLNISNKWCCREFEEELGYDVVYSPYPEDHDVGYFPNYPEDDVDNQISYDVTLKEILQDFETATAVGYFHCFFRDVTYLNLIFLTCVTRFKVSIFFYIGMADQAILPIELIFWQRVMINFGIKDEGSPKLICRS